MNIFLNEITIYNDSLASETFIVKDLLSKYKYISHNPSIAYAFCRIGYIELWPVKLHNITDKIIYEKR